MDRDSSRGNEEQLVSNGTPVEIADADNIVRPLEHALEHAENGEAKYGIRTALQYLVTEDVDDE